MIFSLKTELHLHLHHLLLGFDPCICQFPQILVYYILVYYFQSEP